MKVIAGLLIIAFIGLKPINAQVNFVNVHSLEEMEEVWKKAKNENLEVLVDVYATWCGPCKWMDANVFSTESAGNYLNKDFVNVKMDGESAYGSIFANEHGLDGYPTLFVFSAEGKLMNKLVGAKEWIELEESLVNTMEYFPALELLDSKFTSGIINRDEYPTYVRALRKMGRSQDALSVISQYVRDYLGDEALTEQDIAVMAFFATPGSDEWAMVTSDIPLLRNSLGEDLSEFIDYALSQSIIASVEDKDFTITNNFISILPLLAQGTDLNIIDIKTSSYIYYCHYTEQFDQIITFIDDTYAGPKKGDHEWLFKAALDAVFLDARNAQMAEQGIKWFKQCLLEKETYDYYFHLALSLFYSDLRDESLESFIKALSFATSEEQRITTQGIISEIEAME